MERIRSIALAAIAAAGCLITAGCATSAHEAASTLATPSGAAPAPARLTPSARLAPLPISGPCKTSELSLATSGHRTLTGLQVERFLATDAANVACSLTGAPKLTPYGPLSSTSAVTNDIAVSQQDFEEDDEGGGTTTEVDLQPGQSAAFDVAWYSASPVVCEQATGFGFSAPGDTDWTDMRQVRYTFGHVCDGQFYVSPVRPAAK